jgi:hypothetical protein
MLVLQHVPRQEATPDVQEKAHQSIVSRGWDAKLHGKTTKAFGGHAYLAGPKGVSFTPVEAENQARGSGSPVFAVGSFDNPLSVTVEEKAALPEQYGKTGAALTKALQKQGHDALFVTLGGELLEVIAFDTSRLSRYSSYADARAAADGTRQAQRQQWVAVDLDGTLIEYASGDGARGVFGPAKDGARHVMRELKSLGWRVSVFTARIGDGPAEEAQALADQIAEYLEGQGVPFDDVWIGRKPRADYFVDDRAIPFDGDWDAVLRSLVSFGGGDGPSGNDEDVSLGPHEESGAIAVGAGTGLIDSVDNENDFEPDAPGGPRYDRSFHRAPEREHLLYRNGAMP